jgi:beta-fructofuranosidase
MSKPIFHLQPEQNWMNDPNGPVFFKNQLHMFFQHNPLAPVMGNMTWGHAVSDDMVSWRLLPVALSSSKEYDKDGVWSGCSVVKDDILHILYTGVFPETLCLATGDGETFQKYENNPILTRGDRKLVGWRDPFVWKGNNKYRLIIGSGDSQGGFTEIYESEDLLHFTLLGKFLESASFPLKDEMWECPVFYPQNDEGALFISAQPEFVVRTFVGKYENARLSDAKVARADLGDCMYAPNIAKHPDGRSILFGWIHELGSEEERIAQGWQGLLTLPRELRIQNGELYTSVAKETQKLRGKQLLNGASEILHRHLGLGRHTEIDLTARLSGSSIELGVLKPNDAPGLSLLLEEEQITIDKGNNDGFIAKIQPQETMNFHFFIDDSVIEIYINSKEVLTTRYYSTPENIWMDLLVHKPAEIVNIQGYELKKAVLSSQ